MTHPNYSLSLDKFTQILCLLLIGFLTGNLFGTFLNTIRKYIMWDGIIVFFIVSLIEISNYNVYHKKSKENIPLSFRLKKASLSSLALKNRSFLINKQSSLPERISFTSRKGLNRRFLSIMPEQNKANRFWKFFNFFKIGLMVGFFVDAFKVGS